MQSRKLRLITKTICLVALAIPVQLTAQHGTLYTLTDLGTLGGTFSVPLGMNNKGWVNGFSTLPGDAEGHAFLWKKGVMIDIGTLGGPNSTARWPLNERGEVTGSAETPTPHPLGEDFCGFGTQLVCPPFLWEKGVMTPLPTLGGTSGEARQINNRGQIVGNAETGTLDPTCPPEVNPIFSFKPVLWEKGEIQEFPTFPDSTLGQAHSINDRGQAVGLTGVCTGFLHAVLWDHGTLTDLGNLGEFQLLSPIAINNRTQVAGVAFSPVTTTAFLWENGVATNLGTLPGDFSSRANWINSKGQVVGGSCDIAFNCRGFLWQNAVMTDLTTVITHPDLFLLVAVTLNDRGQIGGLALQISTGELHAVLATPTNAAADHSATLAPRGQTRRGRKFVLPANVRKMLRESLTKPYLRGRLGVWNLK
jgi:probable HAF family extracellular repeat protein